MAKGKFGIPGLNEVERDEDGFIEIPVVVQASGLYFGSPPPELRIHCILTYNDDELNKAYVAKLNRRTDLPFHLAKAKIKVFGKSEKIMDADLELLGIEPFEEESGD